MTFRIGTPFARGAGYSHSRYSADSKLVEKDVQTCTHCQAVILMQDWKDNGGWCSKCEAPLCNRPECMAQTNRLGCVPFMKRLESYIETTVKFEQHLKIAGLEPRPVPQQLILP